MFKESYRKLFWGFIITFIDFRFNSLNILPDIIGYLLIVVALGQLVEEHQSFGRAKNYAMVLIFFSIPDIYQENNILQGFNIVHTYTLATFILSGIGIILNLFMVYYICKGIFELSKERQLDELNRMTRSRWKAYLAINTALLIFIPFAINISENIVIKLFIGMSIAGFIIHILIMALIRHASNQLSNDAGAL